MVLCVQIVFVKIIFKPRARYAIKSMRRSAPRAAVRLRSPRQTDVTAFRYNFRWLTIWHFVAAGVHGLSFLALLIVYLIIGTDKSFAPQLYSDTLQFDNGTVDNKLLEDASGYSLAIVLLFMPAITSVFHIGQGFGTMRYETVRKTPLSRDDWLVRLTRGVNWVRWLEYSITASLMTWIVAQLSGITNVYLLWLLAVVCNVALQWHGFFYELNFESPPDNTQAGKYKKDVFGNMEWKKLDSGDEPEQRETFDAPLRQRAPMLNGFVIFLGQWSILWCYFLRTVSASEEGAPWFVYMSFFGLFFTFLTFPMVQILYVRRNSSGALGGLARCIRLTDWYAYEFAFIVLSAFSKLFLDWTLFGALISTSS